MFYLIARRLALAVGMVLLGFAVLFAWLRAG